MTDIEVIRLGIIVVVLAVFFLERFVSYLNHRSFKAEIPPAATEIYSHEEYKRAFHYQKVNYAFAWITSTVGLLAFLIFFLAGGFLFLHEITVSLSQNESLQVVFYFLMLGFLSDLLGLPFAIINTFYIEEGFGFNKTSPRTFILDKFKGYLLALLLGAPILFLISWFYYQLPDQFWFIAFTITAIISIIMSAFYTSLLLPLFNKLTPLSNTILLEKISAYCRQNNFKFDRIFQMDGSKRSSRANAFFSGIGPRKSIVLFDTLVNKYPDDQLIAILAHEVGHYRLRHTMKMMITGLLQMLLIFWILGWFLSVPEFSQALGGTEAIFHLGLTVFVLIYSPVSLLTGILINSLSRRFEFEADDFAAKTSDSEALATALVRLSSDNLSNPTPHPAYVLIHYSHPPLLLRLANLRKTR